MTQFDARVLGCRCDVCPLAGKGCGPVDVGAPVYTLGKGAQLRGEMAALVVTDAPSPRSVAAGRPVAGPPSKMLADALARAGLGGVAITHLLLCRPEVGIEAYLRSILKENKRRGVARRKYEKRLATIERKWLRAVKAWEGKVAREDLRWRKAVVRVWTRYEKTWTRLQQKNLEGPQRIALQNERIAAQNTRIKEQNERRAARSQDPRPLKLRLPSFDRFRLPPTPEVPVLKDFGPCPEREPKPEDPGDTSEIMSPIDCCAPRLRNHLDGVTSVLMVGKYTLGALTGLGKIQTEQGFPVRVDGSGWLESRETPLWGTAIMHPAGVVGNPKLMWMRGPFYHWITKWARLHRTGGPDWQEPSPLYTAPCLHVALTRLVEEADRRMFESGAPLIDVAMDVETDGLNVKYAKLRCIGFAWGGYAAVVPVHSVSGAYIAREEILDLARQVLDHPHIRIIMHNGAFDRSVLETKGFPVTRVDGGDTLLAHHVIESELRHGLSFVCSLLLDCPSWKEADGGGDHGLSAVDDYRLWLYNARDTWRTLKCHESLLKSIKRDKLDEVYAQACLVQPWVADIWSHGLYVHRDKLEAIVERLNREHVRCAEEVAAALAAAAKADPKAGKVFEVTLCGDPFDYNRPMHREGALRLCGIDTPQTKTGFRSTKADDLVRIMPDLPGYARAFIGCKVTEHDEGHGLLGAKSTEKIVSTFCATDGIDPDGRRRTSWKQHGTVSGRWSSGNKALVSTDTNFQNIPEWVRAMYGAEPGAQLVSADYSALELWVVGIYTEATALLEALGSSDVHRFNTEGLFGISFSDKMLEAASIGCGGKHTYAIPAACGTVGLPRSAVHLEDAGKKIKVSWRTDCKACRAVGEAASKEMQDRLMRLRVQAKRFVYNANYQGSDTSIWLKLQTEFPALQLSDVQGMMEAWGRMNPQINAKAHENYERYHHRRLRQGHGYLESPIMGRRRYWVGKDFKLTDAANYPVQSGAADVVNAAILRIGPPIRDLGGRLIFQIHDSFGAEIEVAKADGVRQIMDRELPGSYAFREGAKGLWSFPVESAIGTYWNEV